MTQRHPAFRRWLVIPAIVLCSLAVAETTQRWEQESFSDFEQGKAANVSIRSNGKIELGPKVQDLFETPAAYIWALAADSNGNVFAGGGPDASVFRIGADGRKATFFETDALEVHALAIDGNDNVYAATFPDSKVYKIDPSGKFEVFFDPGADYIWAMAFDRAGDLFVATGNEGVIFRVTPAGESSEFFRTEESHVRALAFTASGDLVVGTDPGGLILRITRQPGETAKGFVLYQSSRKEITALVVAPDGTIYAAGVGSRTPTPPGVAPPTVSAVTTAQPGTPGPPQPTAAPTPSPQAPAQPGAAPRVVGGSEIYRIAKDGEPQVIWNTSSDIVYSLALGKDGKLIAGTGDRGRLIRVDSDTSSTLLLTSTSSQITALAPAGNGGILAAMSNISKIVAVGPELASEGSFESDIFDAEIFSTWGRLEWRGETPAGASISVSARSGNMNGTARNWSNWSAGVTTAEGAPSAAPSSRFAQWRAVLKAGDGGSSPVLDAVNLYYRPKNIAPAISEIQVTPANYRFVASPLNVKTRNLNLPPLGNTGPRRRRTTSVASASGHTLAPEPGALGVRWAANDENGDDIVAKVEIRGAGEQNWILVEDEISGDYATWDSTSFPDGLYTVRVTASDALSNPAAEALSVSRISEPFVIDNGEPRIASLTAMAEGGRLRVKFEAADSTSVIERAECSVDGGEWKPVLPSSGLFDSKGLEFDFLTGEADSGEHTVAVRIYDAFGNVAAAKTVVR